jgi:hypothetical protein
LAAKQSPHALKVRLIGFPTFLEIASGKNRPRNDTAIMSFDVSNSLFGVPTMKPILPVLLLLVLTLNACAPATPDATAVSSETVAPIATWTPAPTPTETATPTTTPDPNRVDVVSVETLPIMISRQDENVNVVVPNSPEEYLLGIKVPGMTNLDGVKMVVGDAEIIPAGIETWPDGFKEVFYSIPRETKELKLRTVKGDESDVSKFLSQQEPENAFIQTGETFVINGFDVRIIEVLANLAKLGYRKGYDFPIVWFPAPSIDERYVVVNIKFDDKKKASPESLKAAMQNIILVVDGDISANRLRKPIEGVRGWGVNEGRISVFLISPKDTDFKIVFLDSRRIFQINQ